VTDTARLLLTIAALSAVVMAALTWNVLRGESASPARLIAQLRVSQWAAVMLAAVGGISIGLSVAAEAVPSATLDVTIGAVLVLAAAAVIQREPRVALIIAATAFVAHALTDLAHRPGWLSPDLSPRWYIVGSAIYDVCVAALCYVATRR
jgi:hypothetical protein